MKNVIAFIEHKDGQVRRVSLEAACAAREIADKLAAHMEQGISNAAPDSDGFVGPL